MSFVYVVSIILFVFVAALLCFSVLIQESKSSGLGAAFGAGDAGQSMFGTSTADVLKKFTAWLAIIFMSSCVLLSFWTSSIGRSRSQQSSTLIEQQENK